MTHAPRPLATTLLKAAWLSVILGLGMELLLLAVSAYFKHSMGTQTIIADLIQKISWSTLVCTGVALGFAATKMRSSALGVAGLIAAPISFYVAKIAHKSVAQALSLAGSIATGPSPIVLATIKGLEYAALGYFIGQLGKRAAGLLPHAATGLAIGITFGGAIVLLTVSAATEPLPAFAIVSRVVNEVIFPVGCATVLYTAQKLAADHSKSSSRPA